MTHANIAALAGAVDAALDDFEAASRAYAGAARALDKASRGAVGQPAEHPVYSKAVNFVEAAVQSRLARLREPMRESHEHKYADVSVKRPAVQSVADHHR
ncbi:MAG: hypothetical protein ACFCUT_03705 [Kiloniellaceae bacterium]